MLGSIKYNLAHLTDFSGRDARQTFWFYVLFLVIIQIVIGVVSSMPMYLDMFGQAFNAARSGASQTDLQATMVQNMLGHMQTQVLVGMIIGIVMVLLLGAAFVRRLHDAGFSGWWAVIPASTYIFASIYNFANIGTVIQKMQEIMTAGDIQSMQTMQAEMASYGLVSWIGIIVVIGFGVLKSQDGPNQFGDEPVRF